MKFTYVYNLVLEITRRCNMNCAHCMRGDAQGVDMSRTIIDRALDSADHIGSIVFSGGEPSLVPELIQYTLSQCKEKNIPVDSFYIVTNGKHISTDFLRACLDWWVYVNTGEYSDECGYSGVALSKDIFHEAIPEKNIRLLSGLSFFQPGDKATDFDEIGVLPIGRGKDLTAQGFKANKYRSTDVTPEKFFEYIEPHPSDPELWTMNEYPITVTVNGDVLSECDYAYNDTEHLKMGNVMDENWLESAVNRFYIPEE